MNDLADDAAIVEDRARKICAGLGVDPDEILDPYGPVRRWDAVAYHIGEVIETTRRPVPADVADLVSGLSTWATVIREAEKPWSGELSGDLDKAASLLTTLAQARDYYAGLYAERCGDLLASGRDEWLPIEDAPSACHVEAARFDWDAGEWTRQIVKSPPIRPFTIWRMLDEIPPHLRGDQQ